MIILGTEIIFYSSYHKMNFLRNVGKQFEAKILKIPYHLLWLLIGTWVPTNCRIFLYNQDLHMKTQCKPSQDEHYDSRIRSSTTPSAIVYGRIRCKLRSYTVVFRLILDSWITTVSRHVVYDEIRPYTVVYDVVYHRILPSMFLVKRWDLPFPPPAAFR